MTTATETAVELLRAACERRGYRLTLADARGGACAVDDGSRRVVLHAGVVPLNAHAAALVAKSKHGAAAVLKRAGYRVPEGVAVALQGGAERRAADAEALREWLARRGYPVFVKPDAGSWGRLARRAEDGDELHEQLGAIAVRHADALVQEVVHGEEYRVFVLDGEPLFAYRRRIGRIEGDGVRSFEELLAAYAARHPSMNLEYGIDRTLILRQMLRARCTWRSVLPRGVTIRLSDAANFIAGGESDEFRAGELGAWRAWARGVAGALALRVCGIDLVAGDLDDPSAFVVLEVNANPGLTSLFRFGHHELALEIWGSMLAKALDESGSRQT